MENIRELKRKAIQAQEDKAYSLKICRISGWIIIRKYPNKNLMSSNGRNNLFLSIWDVALKIEINMNVP